MFNVHYDNYINKRLMNVTVLFIVSSYKIITYCYGHCRLSPTHTRVHIQT